MAETVIFLEFRPPEGQGDSACPTGESDAAGHVGALEITGFEWSAKAESRRNAVADANRNKPPKLHELTVKRYFDSATPTLLGGMIAKQATRYESARLSVHNFESVVQSDQAAKRMSVLVYRIDLWGVAVENIKLNAQPKGKSSVALEEEMTLSYQKMRMTYLRARPGEVGTRSQMLTFDGGASEAKSPEDIKKHSRAARKSEAQSAKAGKQEGGDDDED